MIKVKNLYEATKYLSLLAETLIPYSYPAVTVEVEEEFLAYKTWNFSMDGYDICCHLTEFKVNESVIRNLQIFPKKLYLLPFHVNFKVAVAFFGTENLVTFSVVKDGHLVSCWTKIKDQSEDSTVSVKRSIPSESYLGVEYGILY
jgi:hypothetical protein